MAEAKPKDHNSKFFLSRGKNCCVCGHLTSQSELVEMVCNKCRAKFDNTAALETVIIQRAEAGKKTAIKYLETHGFVQQE